MKNKKSPKKPSKRGLKKYTALLNINGEMDVMVEQPRRGLPSAAALEHAVTLAILGGRRPRLEPGLVNVHAVYDEENEESVEVD